MWIVRALALVSGLGAREPGGMKEEMKENKAAGGGVFQSSLELTCLNTHASMCKCTHTEHRFTLEMGSKLG